MYNTYKPSSKGGLSKSEYGIKNQTASSRLYNSTSKNNKVNLNSILKDYKTFCDKYFNNTTPIGSMNQQQFEKKFQDNNTANQQNSEYDYNEITDISDEELLKMQKNVESQMLSDNV